MWRWPMVLSLSFSPTHTWTHSLTICLSVCLTHSHSPTFHLSLHSSQESRYPIADVLSKCVANNDIRKEIESNLEDLPSLIVSGAISLLPSFPLVLLLLYLSLSLPIKLILLSLSLSLSVCLSFSTIFLFLFFLFFSFFLFHSLPLRWPSSGRFSVSPSLLSPLFVQFLRIRLLPRSLIDFFSPWGSLTFTHALPLIPLQILFSLSLAVKVSSHMRLAVASFILNLYIFVCNQRCRWVFLFIFNF